MHRNRKAARDRNGAERRSPHLSRVFLEICQICHTALNTHYEDRAKEPVREILDRGNDLHTRDDVDAVARWMIKTLALYRHPNSRHEGSVFRPRPDGEDDFEPLHAWDPFPAELARAIRTGTAPTEVSLWLALATDAPGAEDPALSWDVWATVPPEQLCTIGFSVAAGRAEFQLAYHPERPDLEHPFAATGQVVRLWPDPPASVSLAALTPVPLTTRLPSAFAR